MTSTWCVRCVMTTVEPSLQVVRLPVDEGEEALLLCGAQRALLRWLDEAVIPFEDGREHLQGVHSRLHYSQLHCCYYCRPVY